MVDLKRRVHVCEKKSVLSSIKVRTLAWTVALLVVLEPWFTDKLIEDGFFPEALAIIALLSSGLRIVISGIAAFLFLCNSKVYTRYLALFGISLLGICASFLIIYGWSQIASLVGPFKYFGLAIMLYAMFKRDSRCLRQALMVVFAILSFAAFITIFFFNGGLIDTDLPTDKLYSFGGKNSFFVTFIPIIGVLAFCSGVGRRSTSFVYFLISICLLLISLYIQSAGSAVCFFMAALALVPISRYKYIVNHINPIALFVIFCAVFFGTVLTNALTVNLGPIFDILGRSADFTGRETLWNQAKKAIILNPLFGNGGALTFFLGNDAVKTAHAHCFFLDNFAKYGLIFIAPFLLDALFLIRRSKRAYTSKSMAPYITIYLLILFHSAFDDLLIPFYIIVRFLLYVELEKTDTKEKRQCMDSKTIASLQVSCCK